MRRTSLEIIYDWKVSSKLTEYTPLIEIYPQQTLPNVIDGAKPEPTWELRTKASWHKYQGYIRYKKAVCKYPVMNFSCAPELWIVSEGGLIQDLGYYG